MNYTKHYGLLIERARKREKPDTYLEKHHVTPKCMGGVDDSENLVFLTAEEHFVAHQLLVKMNPGVIALVLALNLMSASPTGRRNNNRRYGWIKRALSGATSERFKGRKWSKEQNVARSAAVAAQWADPEFKVKRSAAMSGRRWSDESRAARSASMKGKPGRVWTAEQKAKLSATQRTKFLQSQTNC